MRKTIQKLAALQVETSWWDLQCLPWNTAELMQFHAGTQMQAVRGTKCTNNKRDFWGELKQKPLTVPQFFFHHFCYLIRSSNTLRFPLNSIERDNPKKLKYEAWKERSVFKPCRPFSHSPPSTPRTHFLRVALKPRLLTGLQMESQDQTCNFIAGLGRKKDGTTFKQSWREGHKAAGKNARIVWGCVCAFCFFPFYSLPHKTAHWHLQHCSLFTVWVQNN